MCWRSSIAAMPKGWGSPQPCRSPIVMGWSFMVPKPATTPKRPGCSGRRDAGNMLLVAAGEIMGAGFGIRTRLPSYHWGRKTDAPFGAAVVFERPVGRFFLLGCSVLTRIVVTVVFTVHQVSPVVLRLQGEPVAIAGSGRWAIALILKPVPNVSADNGRLNLYWLKDNGNCPIARLARRGERL